MSDLIEEGRKKRLAFKNGFGEPMYPVMLTKIEEEFNNWAYKNTTELLNQLEQREKENLELKLNQERMLLQVKNRMPIEISEKVDSWPRCLTAVAQLKQERNNADYDLEQLQQSNKLKDNVIEAYKNAYKVRSRLNVHNLYKALKEYGE